MFKRVKNFVNNSIYQKEFRLAIATFIINIPPLFLIIMEYFRPCTIYSLLLMYGIIPPHYMIPPYCFGYIIKNLFNLVFLFDKLPILEFCIFQLVLNTIALVKILIFRDKSNNDYRFCLKFIIINYIIMLLFNVLYLKIRFVCCI